MHSDFNKRIFSTLDFDGINEFDIQKICQNESSHAILALNGNFRYVIARYVECNIGINGEIDIFHWSQFRFWIASCMQSIWICCFVDVDDTYAQNLLMQMVQTALFISLITSAAHSTKNIETLSEWFIAHKLLLLTKWTTKWLHNLMYLTEKRDQQQRACVCERIFIAIICGLIYICHRARNARNHQPKWLSSSSAIHIEWNRVR